MYVQHHFHHFCCSRSRDYSCSNLKATESISALSLPALRQIAETSSICLAAYWSLPKSSSTILAVIFDLSLLDVPLFHLHPTPSLISLWSLCISCLPPLSTVSDLRHLSSPPICLYFSIWFSSSLSPSLPDSPLCLTLIHSFSLSFNLCTAITPFHQSNLPYSLSAPSGCSSINRDHDLCLSVSPYRRLWGGMSRLPEAPQ